MKWDKDYIYVITTICIIVGLIGVCVGFKIIYEKNQSNYDKCFGMCEYQLEEGTELMYNCIKLCNGLLILENAEAINIHIDEFDLLDEEEFVDYLYETLEWEYE